MIELTKEQRNRINERLNAAGFRADAEPDRICIADASVGWFTYELNLPGFWPRVAAIVDALRAEGILPPPSDTVTIPKVEWDRLVKWLKGKQLMAEKDSTAYKRQNKRDAQMREAGAAFGYLQALKRVEATLKPPGEEPKGTEEAEG